MRKNVRYHYYVEGNCEKKLIDELKTTVTYIEGICGLFLYAGLCCGGLFFCRYMDGGCNFREKRAAGDGRRILYISR